MTLYNPNSTSSINANANTNANTIGNPNPNPNPNLNPSTNANPPMSSNTSPPVPKSYEPYVPSDPRLLSLRSALTTPNNSKGNKGNNKGKGPHYPMSPVAPPSWLSAELRSLTSVDPDPKLAAADSALSSLSSSISAHSSLLSSVSSMLSSVRSSRSGLTVPPSSRPSASTPQALAGEIAELRGHLDGIRLPVTMYALVESLASEAERRAEEWEYFEREGRYARFCADLQDVRSWFGDAENRRRLKDGDKFKAKVDALGETVAARVGEVARERLEGLSGAGAQAHHAIAPAPQRAAKQGRKGGGRDYERLLGKWMGVSQSFVRLTRPCRSAGTGWEALRADFLRARLREARRAVDAWAREQGAQGGGSGRRRSS